MKEAFSDALSDSGAVPDTSIKTVTQCQQPKERGTAMPVETEAEAEVEVDTELEETPLFKRHSSTQRMEKRRYYRQHKRRIQALRKGTLKVRHTSAEKTAMRGMRRLLKKSGVRARLSRLHASIDDQNLPQTLLGEVAHPKAYIRAVIEAASMLDAQDAREFAKLFIDRDPAYSATQTGATALLFESWLAEGAQELFDRLLETITEAAEPTFLAIFEGKITKEEEKKVKEQFDAAEFETLLEAGAVDRQDGSVSDVTILEGKPKKKKKKEPQEPDVEPDATDADMPDYKEESHAPKSREDYEKVIEDGGVTPATMLFLYPKLEEEAKLNEADATIIFTDPNDVTWFIQGGNWQPNENSLNEKKWSAA